VSVLSRFSVTPLARRLLQRLRTARGDAENPYSAVASLTLLMAVGVAVKFVH
jgi:hypothetical protein